MSYLKKAINALNSSILNYFATFNCYHLFSLSITRKIYTVSWSKKPYVPRQLDEGIMPIADKYLPSFLGSNPQSQKIKLKPSQALGERSKEPSLPSHVG